MSVLDRPSSIFARNLHYFINCISGGPEAPKAKLEVAECSYSFDVLFDAVQKKPLQ